MPLPPAAPVEDRTEALVLLIRYQDSSEAPELVRAAIFAYESSLAASDLTRVSSYFQPPQSDGSLPASPSGC